jgi:hypothetical protein
MIARLGFDRRLRIEEVSMCCLWGATTLCAKVLSSLTAAAAADFWEESIVPRPLQPRGASVVPARFITIECRRPLGWGWG